MKARFGARAVMIVGAAIAFGLWAVAAQAEPIGPNCSAPPGQNSCFGNVFTLEFSNLTAPTPGPNSTQDLDLTLRIDTATTTLAASDVIRNIAFKVTPQTSDVNTATLNQFLNDGADAGVGNWSIFFTGLGNNGCSGGGGGFVCAQDANVAPLDGSEYTWVFHLNIDSSTLLVLPFGASIKARYCVGGTTCEQGDFQGITSEPITLQPVGGQPVGGQPVGGQPVGGQPVGGQPVGGTVPQPSGLMLVGTALLGGLALSAGLRRLRRRSE